MTPEERFAAAWDVLPPTARLHVLAQIFIPLAALWAKGKLMNARVRAVFIASALGFIALFWIFADKLPGRVLLIAGVAWGAITLAALVAAYLPWDGGGKGGDDPPN